MCTEQIFSSLFESGYSNPEYFDILQVIVAEDANGNSVIFDIKGNIIENHGINIDDYEGEAILSKGSYSVTYKKRSI